MDARIRLEPGRKVGNGQLIDGFPSSAAVAPRRMASSFLDTVSALSKALHALRRDVASSVGAATGGRQDSSLDAVAALIASCPTQAALDAFVWALFEGRFGAEDRLREVNPLAAGLAETAVVAGVAAGPVPCTPAKTVQGRAG